jgi:hypothetical protein
MPDGRIEASCRRIQASGWTSLHQTLILRETQGTFARHAGLNPRDM